MSNLYAVSGLIARRYHTTNPLVLIAKRAAHKPYPNLWEFPGGKLEPGENPQEAIKRELAEELSGLQVSANHHIATVSVGVNGVERDIALYWCLVPANTAFDSIRPSLDSLQRLEWISPRTLEDLPLIPGAQRFAPHVLRWFFGGAL